MHKLAPIVLALALTGCAGCAAFGQLAKMAGSQWLGTVLDLAEASSERYFERHPNQRAHEVATAHLDVLRAQAAYDRAVRDGAGSTAEKAALVAAYRAYLERLTEFGVGEALAPAGGAEGDGPIPEPVALPSADEVEARL
jgi:hypothetical protein